ncbi:RecX family transcriptional regulator [bacterium]|nr:RecX family transcriptional regulator [bacterium]
MPEITAIKPQVKREGRYNIFVDGKYSFSLSELALATLHLQVGQAVSDADLDKLKEESQRGKAMERAQYFLSFRPRSRAEVATYLKRKDYDDDIIVTTLNELEKARLIDDKAFAAAWVQSRNAVKFRSRRILIQELRQKQVSKDAIEAALSEQTQDIELDNLRQIVRKKNRPGVSWQDPSKLMRYLSTKGFSYSDIRKVLEEELGSKDNF